jgi:solute carrier family 25 (adenine nucleotide translocator) protein 4/5/6/31
LHVSLTRNHCRYFPVQGFNFAFKDTIYGVFPHPTGVKAKFVTHVVAGGMAGVCSSFIAYPLDYARLRLAADLGSFIRSFGGLYDVIDKTIKGPGGYWALYRGFGATALAIAPYRGIYFGVNDTFAELNPYQHRSDLAGLTTKFAQAQVAALTAAFVAYPLDTIRRRLQMQSEKPVLERAYTGALNCFSVMVKNEGPAALYKGAGSNAIRTVGSALVLVTYGELMDRSQKK